VVPVAATDKSIRSNVHCNVRWAMSEDIRSGRAPNYGWLEMCFCSEESHNLHSERAIGSSEENLRWAQKWETSSAETGIIQSRAVAGHHLISHMLTDHKKRGGFTKSRRSPIGQNCAASFLRPPITQDGWGGYAGGGAVQVGSLLISDWLEYEASLAWHVTH